MTSRAFFEESVLAFLAPIRPYLDDPTVSEVMINGPHEIFVERAGRLEKTPATFESVEALMAAIRNLSQFVGKLISNDRPILEGHLPDGSRVEAIMPPASHGGPHVAIRRFPKKRLTIGRLIEIGALTPAVAACLAAYARAKVNILVGGGTGSGKTSMLNALSGLIPVSERVVVIEDTREVQFQGEHVVYLEARPADAKGQGAVTIRDLFRASLRMRPDRLVVGEIRGGEALEIVQAMTSGHGGCMGTLHATYPHDTLGRLETMCMMSDIQMPLHAMRLQLASAIQLLVQVSRLRDGSRGVTHVSEVMGFDNESQRYVIQDMFRREFDGVDRGGAVSSRLVPTGATSRLLEQLREHGEAPPPELCGREGPRRGART